MIYAYTITYFSPFSKIKAKIICFSHLQEMKLAVHYPDKLDGGMNDHFSCDGYQETTASHRTMFPILSQS